MNVPPLRCSYCDPVCQKAHWKAGHKSRCKSVEELKNETTSSTRLSVVFPVTGSKSLAGMHSAFINMRASGLQTSKPKISGKITKNIHGDNEFVVKVRAGGCHSSTNFISSPLLQAVGLVRQLPPRPLPSK